MIEESGDKISLLKMELISGRQCAAARAWLGMSQWELVELSGVYRQKIIAFENGEDIELRFQIKLDETIIGQGIVFSEGGELSLPR